MMVIVLLGMIFIEDLYHRAVHWLLFPLLAIALIAVRYLDHNPLTDITKDTLLNVTFLGIQLLLVTLYFSIKHKRLTNITSGLLGWGDILFVLCLSAYLATGPFIVFYILSLLLVLLSWLIYQALTKIESRQIPLAGLQSLLFALVLIGSWLYHTEVLTGNEVLTNWLSR